MIWQVARMGFWRRRHNRGEWLTLLVVPIVFFSVFALIFGRGLGNARSMRVRAVVVSLNDSVPCRQAAIDLRKAAEFRCLPTPAGNAATKRRLAREEVARGAASVAVLLSTASDKPMVEAELLVDPADPIAPGLAQAALMRSLFQDNSAAKIPRTSPTEPTPQNETTSAGVPITVTEVTAETKGDPVVTMYAAGIAVMFLLFGATSGGGSLLEEQENGTLDRLLCSRLTMDHLLMGKWLYLMIVGTAQTTLMFLWGQVIFGVDLLGHTLGFLVMTMATAGAAASFGLVLATLCRSRAQLAGISVIVVLTMSALGGSMVPRYVMSEAMRGWGRFTFNAWALDGFEKVFWRQQPLSMLTAELTVLVLSGCVMLIGARALAVRWEHA